MAQTPSGSDALRSQVTPAPLDLAVARIGLDGRVIEASATLGNLLGYTPESLIGRQFSELFQSLGGQDESLLRTRLLDGELPCYASEQTAITASGREFRARVVFWMDRRGSSGGPNVVSALVDDTTATVAAQQALREADSARRDLARRLTSAQENERTRIARELHDDIGQSLAILRIQMLRAGRPVSGMPGKTHPNLPQLTDSLKEITQRVSRLSHQLHSSELEYLGLATAVQSHCREFTGKFKIPVTCSCHAVPSELENLVALSLLRVIQEALYNAAKYSQANQITVTLTGSPSHLDLLIGDDGVGFDMEEAKLAAGLGLISMRERIKLAGGEFSLSSRPGEGTRIAAKVPLNLPEAENHST